MTLSGKRASTVEEVAKHTSDDDAWIIINGNIWDITGFADVHPGGEEIIKEFFGRDASEVYNDVHGPGLAAKFLGEEKLVGKLSSEADGGGSTQQPIPQTKTNPKVTGELPDLDTVLNLHDFEEIARKHLNERAWVYVSGAANDCWTLSANSEWYRQILLRPRVLEAVSKVDISTEILGQRFEMPIFNAPASLSMLVHPDAEIALAKALSAAGSTIIAPTLASFSLEEISEALPVRHPFFFQLYASQDRLATQKTLDDARNLGARAIMVTVDLPVFSKREANERYEMKVARQKQLAKGASKEKSGQKQARAASNAINADLTWEDIQWIKDYTGLPVVLKGIQRADDALKALRQGCAGIYISNHGGRGIDTAQASLLTLAEIRATCPEVLEKMDVFIDGGIRRGTDILKAICLGAKGVCLGRPCFYALMYGQPGVEHLINSESPLRDPSQPSF